MATTRQGNARRRVRPDANCGHLFVSSECAAERSGNVVSAAGVPRVGARGEMAVGSSLGSKKRENVNKQWAWLIAGVVTLAALLVQLVPVHATDNSSKAAAADLELICLTEQPAIVEGESATLRAWASTSDGKPINTSVKFVWEVDAG